MATMIEKSAKNVEEALQAALAELGAGENDVDVEVLENPSKGFLGIIKKKFLPKLSRKKFQILKLSKKLSLKKKFPKKFNTKKIFRLLKKKLKPLKKIFLK